MKTSIDSSALAVERRQERGAALVMSLLISLLLLTAGGALVISTSMTASFTADATSEQQAYMAAEAGLQAALGVLRGHAQPSPSPTPNPASDIADLNKINFRRAVYKRDPGGAVTVPSSNRPSDTSPDARLSRWLRYSTNFPDRVELSDNYNPIRGTAYSIVVTDPDQSERVTYSTTATMSVPFPAVAANSSASSSVTFPNSTSGNRATITYTPQASTTVNQAWPSTTTNLGTFTVTMPAGSAGNVIVDPITITITVNQTKPWAGTTTFTGTITGAVTTASSTLVINWSSASEKMSETKLVLANPLAIVGPNAGGSTPVQATITAPEPRQLLIRSTGYGPGGAQKKLEMLVNRYAFSLNPPAPIVIRGADKPDAATPAPTATFDLGTSNAKFYTGADLSGADPQKPTVAISLHDWTAINTGIHKGSTVADPELSILDLNPVPNPWPATQTPTPAPGKTPPAAVTPDFLRTADNARKFLDTMESRARSEGRYFTTLTGMAGSDSPYAPAFTFVDGNCTLDGGAGMLIVTGNLIMKGNADFKGVILVLGNGHVERDGSGNGKIEGAWYVANFIRRPTAAQSKLFGAPYFNVGGGGDGSFRFSSQRTQESNNLMGGAVAGVVEY